jgi:branched-chain amino acid transport system substrate-binding protein
MQRPTNRALLSILLSFALVALMIGGCTNTTSSSEQEAKTAVLKVGVQTSLTGGLADYGFAAQEGIKLAVKKYDNFKVGDTTYKIELMIKDDKGDPAEAPVVAQSLVDAGANVVIGALTSGNTNASAPIYNKANLIQITGSATRADLVTKGWTNFFRTCVGDNFQGANLAQWVQELGYKKVVLFDDSGDYSVGLADVVESSLATSGVEILRQSCKEGDTDFSAQIANIKKFAPGAVVYTGYHKECGLLRKQMVEAGLGSIQMMGGDGVKSDEIVAEAGGAANAKGMLATFGGVKTDQMPGYKQFAVDYKAATGKDPGPYSETNYDALGAYIAAVQKAGTTDAAAVEKALQENEYSGVIGTFAFNDKGELVLKGASSQIQTIWRYKCDGKTWISVD